MRGELETNIRAYTRVLERNPDNPTVWYLKARALVKLAELIDDIDSADQALQCFDYALEFAPLHAGLMQARQTAEVVRFNIARQKQQHMS